MRSCSAAGMPIPRSVTATATLPGELEDLLDQRREPQPLGPHQLAVLPDARLVADDSVGEVIGGGADDGKRGAQLVRHGGDELELLTREVLRASRRDDEEADAD